MLQLINKFLYVSLLGRGGGYFWGHANIINVREGIRNSGVGLGRERGLGTLLLLLRCLGRYVGRGEDWGEDGGMLEADSCLRLYWFIFWRRWGGRKGRSC